MSVSRQEWLLTVLLTCSLSSAIPEPKTVPVNEPPEWDGRRGPTGEPPDTVLNHGPTGWVDYGFPQPDLDRRADGDVPRATTPRPAAFQTASNYKNMRIHLIYKSTSDLTTAKWDFIKNTLMPKTKTYLNQLLKVYPTAGKLLIPRQCNSAYSNTAGKCAGLKADSDHKCGTHYGAVNINDLGATNVYASNGEIDSAKTKAAGSGGYADTDIIIYVSANSDTGSCASGGSTIAYAGACAYDQYDRPTAGYVNFCPEKVSTAASDLEGLWSTGVHEIMHALGFTSARFAYFWNHGTGQPYTQRCANSATYPAGRPCVSDTASSTAAANKMTFVGATIQKPNENTFKSFTERGSTVYKITTPTALAKARTHFACTTLNGVELENEGGSGTQGSHWEQRLYFNDVMTGVSRDSPVMSAITLAYFYDTGWYIPDYAMGGDFIWGKNAGCPFAMEKCLTSGTTPTVTAGTEGKKYFCVTADETGCDALNIGVGSCGVATVSSIPAYMQYWSGDATKGGKATTMDHCPYRSVYSNRDCRVSTNAKNNDYYGETFGSTSRCFASSLMVSGYTSKSNTDNAACYQYECTSSALRVKIACPVGASGCTSDYLSCPTAGGALTIPASYGFTTEGSFTCPAFSDVCPLKQLGFGPRPGAQASTTSTTSTSSTPAPAIATGKVSQELTFAETLTYDGDVKTVYETAYGVAITIYDTTTSAWKSGCSVTSVVSSRRATTVRFDATVASTLMDTAAASANNMIASPSTFVNAVATANTKLSKSITSPDNPTVGLVSVTGSTADSSRTASIAMSSVLVLIAIVQRVW